MASLLGLKLIRSLFKKTWIEGNLDNRSITTHRKEEDRFNIVSGIFEGHSTGHPITILIPNKDQKPSDYDKLKKVFRPSHADFTYQTKYGIRDFRGGGRSSARETATRVAAGALVKLLLNRHGIEINAFVSQVGHVKMDYRRNRLR